MGKLEIKKEVCIFFDVLGTKAFFDKVKENTQEERELIQKYRDLVKFIKKEVKDIFELSKNKVKYFSDNIFISFDTKVEDIGYILIFLARVQLVSIVKFGLPIRGGITLGNICNTDVLIGKGLIDSYTMEGNANYPMIQMSNEFFELVKGKYIKSLKEISYFKFLSQGKKITKMNPKEKKDFINEVKEEYKLIGTYDENLFFIYNGNIFLHFLNVLIINHSLVELNVTYDFFDEILDEEDVNMDNFKEYIIKKMKSFIEKQKLEIRKEMQVKNKINKLDETEIYLKDKIKKEIIKSKNNLDKKNEFLDVYKKLDNKIITFDNNNREFLKENKNHLNVMEKYIFLQIYLEIFISSYPSKVK